MRYSASFDVRDSRHNFGGVMFFAAGQTPFLVDITALVAPIVGGGRDISIFNHHYINSFMGGDGMPAPGGTALLADSNLADAVTFRMIDLATSAGWPDAGDLRCDFIVSTNRYTFNYFGHLLSAILFITDPGRMLFGFVTDFSGSAESITATAVPNFILEPTLSNVTYEDTSGYAYEPSGIATAAMSTGGVQIGLRRDNAPQYRDWVQQAEPRAKTSRLDASATHPFTHQQLFEACRSVLPFAVIDGFGDGYNYLFKLRPEGCMWSLNACKRAGGEMDDSLFNVSYRAQQLGSFTVAVDSVPPTPLPVGWYLFRGTAPAAPDGFPDQPFTAATIINSGVDPASPLGTGLCRIEASIIAGALWLSMQPSNLNTHPWFYGFQTTLLTAQVISASLSPSAPAAITTQRGELRLAIYGGGATPNALSQCAMIGLRSAAGARAANYYFSSNAVPLTPTGIPGFASGVSLTKFASNHWLGYVGGTNMGDVAFGADLATGASVWVGFEFTPDLAVEGGPAVLRASMS